MANSEEKRLRNLAEEELKKGFLWNWALINTYAKRIAEEEKTKESKKGEDHD